ncbi:type 2 lanthipeptide synthetase LanM family protein [Dactylosporangium sp. CA-233914]|uniref:type 2 lanthipeptide synthetase LanM family protein n=1 Tax=Dactylosporangium sp. CA-233914 TaxID=3239934 RepID=UPI003D91DE2B
MFEHILNAPTWWHGLTRAERADAPLTLTDEERDHGRRRWAAWRDGHILGNKDIRLDRWERLGLTGEQVVELLAEPAESLAARLPGRPPWLDVIAEAWQSFGSARLEDFLTDDPRTGAGHHGRGPGNRVANEAFLHLITPLLAWTRQELRARMAEVSARHGREYCPPLDHPLLRPPTARLIHMIIFVMILEVNVARVEGRLTGETPGQRMASFLDQIREPESALRILAEYPVLGRELAICVSIAIQARTELVDRLLTDLPALRAAFGGRWRGLADVAEFELGGADTHRGGRAEVTITFTDGRKVVYKPRSLRVEVHFNQAVDWLNVKGLRHPLRTLIVIDRGDYGWEEHVAAASCEDREQVDRFFWRHGAYLAVFHAMCGSGMHPDNVVAAGEHPVVADLEAIFQVRPRGTAQRPPPLAIGEAPRWLRESVLRIGLLPDRIITSDRDGVHDAEVSGLAGGGQLSPGQVPMPVGGGTDEVHIVRDRREMPESNNRARLNGSPVDPLARTGILAAGFEACYRIILTNRGELLAPDGPIAQFRADEVRFIPRPTSTYARLQTESYHPDLLRDSLDREIFFEVLSSGLAGLPDRDLVLASEQRQLADQDIPSFHTTPGSVDLYDGYGLIARDFLEMSGLDAVRARIGAMSERDLLRQLWCIRAAMSGLAVGTPVPGRVEPTPLPAAPIDTELAVRAARSVADRLLDAALVAGGEAPSWLSVNLLGDRFWTVGPAGLDVHSGLPGVALFLAQLGAVTGDARYRRPAERIAQQLVEVTARLADRRDLADTLPIGGYTELGGLVYTLGRLAVVWREPALADAARAAAAMCRDRFAEDKALDVIGGTAGAALAILALHHAHPDESTFDAIKAAGAVIADRAIEVPGGIGWRAEFEDAPALLGFSHGASGIGYALARISEVTGDGRLVDLCGRALGFERYHLSPERRNWPDLRTVNASGGFMNAWCHGAGGIGLARAAMLRLPGLSGWHDLIREDLRIATGRVRDDLVSEARYTGTGNDSLCHGDLGLVETLLAAGPALGEPDTADLARRCARAIAERVLDGTPRPGVPQHVSTPGLLMGLAGIGYGLLRTAIPDRVPNVLLLDAAPA